MAAYAAAKGAVEALVRQVALDYGARGIRVNAVAPGIVGAEQLPDAAGGYPIGRTLRPEEVAGAVHFLASDAASGITGVVLPVATVALFALLRDYQRGGHPRLWHDFWRHWRAEFGRSQLSLGLPLLTVWVFAFYLLATRGTPLAAAVAVLGLGYLAVLAYLPPVLAHFDVPATTAWRLAAVTAARNPLRTLGLGLTVPLLLLAMVVAVPVAIPFFLPSAPAALVALVAARGFAALPARPPAGNDRSR